MTCCICREKIKGFGNNPNGAIDLQGNPITWKETDRCCDDCNSIFVIPGRLKIMLPKILKGESKDDNDNR